MGPTTGNLNDLLIGIDDDATTACLTSHPVVLDISMKLDNAAFITQADSGVLAWTANASTLSFGNSVIDDHQWIGTVHKVGACCFFMSWSSISSHLYTAFDSSMLSTVEP